MDAKLLYCVIDLKKIGGWMAMEETKSILKFESVQAAIEAAHAIVGITEKASIHDLEELRGILKEGVERIEQRWIQANPSHRQIECAYYGDDPHPENRVQGSSWYERLRSRLWLETSFLRLFFRDVLGNSLGYGRLWIDRDARRVILEQYPTS